MTNPSKAKEFIDLHTVGIGYLNRVREVSVRSATPYLACTIAALHGSREKPDRTYFDLTVSGAEAERVIRKAKDAVDANAKVFIGFRIGDTFLSKFEYKSGPKKGQQGAGIKGRLLFVQFINIDGVRVYDAPAKENDDDTAGSSSQDLKEPVSVGDSTESPAEQAEAA